MAYFRAEIIDGNPEARNIIEHFVLWSVVFVRVERARMPSIISSMSPSLLGSYICRTEPTGRRTMCFLSSPRV